MSLFVNTSFIFIAFFDESNSFLSVASNTLSVCDHKLDV